MTSSTVAWWVGFTAVGVGALLNLVTDTTFYSLQITGLLFMVLAQSND